MKVVSIHLMNTDYSYIKQNICNLKTSIDPADVRLRKKDTKNEREIKHSFYYIPSNLRDLVIIGFDSEVKKGQRIIKDFLLRQNTLENNQSLCFLCPTYLSNTINNFKNDHNELLRNRNVHLKMIEPNYIRKHLNINLEGKWKDIITVKNYLFRCFSDFYNSSAFLSFNTSHLASINFIPNKKKSSIYDFLQYTYNQEHKLISKNLRKYFIEKNYVIKNWDYISEELFVLDKIIAESKNNLNLAQSSFNNGILKKEEFNSSINIQSLNNFTFNNTNINSNNTPNTYNSNSNLNINIKEYTDKEDDSNNNLLKMFLKTYDRDTALNYMLNYFPGDYNKYFGISKIDLCDHLIFYLEEANNSYNHHRKDDESEKNDNCNEIGIQNNNSSYFNNNLNKLFEKENKYEENKSLFTDQSEILVSENEPNTNNHFQKDYKKSVSKKRRKSKSISKGKDRDRDFKEKEYNKERDYDKEKEYYKEKDYRERDKEKEHKEKDYYKEKDFIYKEIIKENPFFGIQSEVLYSGISNMLNIENKISYNNQIENNFLKNEYNLINQKDNSRHTASEYFNNILMSDVYQFNNNSDNSLLKKIYMNQESNKCLFSKSKENATYIREEIINKNNSNINNQDDNSTDNSNQNINMISDSYEIKNTNNNLLNNFNPNFKSKSFGIKNICTNENEDIAKVKNNISLYENNSITKDNKISKKEMSTDNLKNLDLNTDNLLINENFLKNKLSEINRSFFQGNGNIYNLKNIPENQVNSINNIIDSKTIYNDNYKNNFQTKSSLTKKDSINNENFINQELNNNNITSQNCNDMMNILYNFSNINQMNINININSNYKDNLQKTQGERLFLNKELEFLKNFENYKILKFLNNSNTSNTKNNLNAPVGNEIKLNLDLIDNDISLLKNKLKSFDNNFKNEGKKIINYSFIEKKFNNKNINMSNISDLKNLNLEEKIQDDNINFEKNNRNYESINHRKLDSSNFNNNIFFNSSNNSKIDKCYDNKYLEYNKYQQDNNNNFSFNKNNSKTNKPSKTLYGTRRKHTSSSKSKDLNNSISPPKLNSYVKNENNFRKDSSPSDTEMISDNSSSKKKDNIRDNSTGNYVYKRMKIKMLKKAKNKKEKSLSESSSPQFSLNEKNSSSISKNSNKQISIFKKKNKKHYKQSKEISNRSSNEKNLMNKNEINRSKNKKNSYKQDDTIDSKFQLNKNIENLEDKENTRENISSKYNSKYISNDQKKKRNSLSRSPLSKSKSNSKSNSYSCVKSSSYEKHNFNHKTYVYGTSNQSNNFSNNLFNTFEKRKKTFGNNAGN